jgi:hypothetical protein
MKNYINFFLLFLAQITFAQNVVLNKVVKINTNADKIFYKIDPQKSTAEYLGEVEIQGFSDDDARVFGLIYKKAKEVGANAFSYQPIQSISGEISQFDVFNYRLNLYYTSAENIPAEKNYVYLIASPNKKQTIAVNKNNVDFLPRTFKKIALLPGENYSVSTRELLGSGILLAAQENQAVQYFQFSSFSVNSNRNGNPGISLKSGDIIKLERSYAEFLTTIYAEFQ